MTARREGSTSNVQSADGAQEEGQERQEEVPSSTEEEE